MKLLPEDSKSKKQTGEGESRDGTSGSTLPPNEATTSIPEGPPPRVDENPFEPGHEPPPRGSDESIPKKGILSPPKKPFSYKIHGKNVSFGSVVVQVFSSESAEETSAPMAVVSAPDEVQPDNLWSKVREDKAHAQRIAISSNGAGQSGLNVAQSKKPSPDSPANQAGLTSGMAFSVNGLGGSPAFGAGGLPAASSFGFGSAVPAFSSLALPGLGMAQFAGSTGSLSSPMTSSQNSPLNSPVGNIAASPLGMPSASSPGLSIPPSSAAVAVQEEDEEEEEEEDEDDDE